MFSCLVVRVPELKGHQAGAYFQSRSGNPGFDGVWVFLRQPRRFSAISIGAFANLCCVYGVLGLPSWL